MKAKSITQVASWPLGAGSLFAARVVRVRANPFIPGGEDIMYAQGGLSTGMLLGDPNTIRKRTPASPIFVPHMIPDYPFGEPGSAGSSIVTATDFPWLFPHMSYTNYMQRHPECRIGSTASPSVYQDEHGLWHHWFCATVSPGGDSDYLFNFTVRHAVSDDMVTLRPVHYKRQHDNVAVQDAALWCGEFKPTTRYTDPSGKLLAFGIAAVNAFLMPPGGLGTRYLYLTLRVFTTGFVDNGGRDKNAAVRLNMDKPGADFEIWHVTRDGAEQWEPVVNGQLPAWLFTRWDEGNPYMWALDWVGLSPDWYAGRGKFMAVSGQPLPDTRQMTVMWSNTITSWPTFEVVELGAPIGGLNYRSYSPSMDRFYFSSADSGLRNGKAASGVTLHGDENQDQAVFEVEPEPRT